jgi:F0F1-type ATP synthase epsilon subunit
LQTALSEIETLEKVQAETATPKSEQDISEALEQLDAAQKQIETARAELQQKRQAGNDPGGRHKK